MGLRLCNLLPFCPTYRFDDGSVIRRSSRESVTYDHFGKLVHVDFYYDGSKGYLYYLPKTVTGEERGELIQKLEMYCKRKWYRARLGD